MKKIISFLLVSFSLTGQLVSRSPETRKDHANVFYDPKYTLFDLFSDEPIFPNNSGEYDVILSSNENKKPQRYFGNGIELSKLMMYKFKNTENHQRWARGEVYSNITSRNSTKDVNKAASEKSSRKNTNVPFQLADASGNFSYFEGLIKNYVKVEVDLNVPQAKDKAGNFLWGDLTDENKDGFGIMYTPGKTLKIGVFKDLKLDGSGINLNWGGRISLGNFKSDEIVGLGFMGYLKDSTTSLELAKQILSHKNNQFLVEDNFERFYLGTFHRNEKNERVFDGKFIRNRFDEKSKELKIRIIVTGRQVNAKQIGTAKLILESPAGSNFMQGSMVYTGELDANNSPKGSGFHYTIYPDKYIRLSGDFNGLYEVNGSREHSNGIIHVGLFKDDNLIGEGKMILSDKVIKGTFKDYIPHGKVRIEYNNGDNFEGNFVDGSAQGLGVTYTASTDEKLSGNYTNGKPNGKMKLTKGKKTTMVTYVDGEKQ